MLNKELLEYLKIILDFEMLFFVIESIIVVLEFFM